MHGHGVSGAQLCTATVSDDLLIPRLAARYTKALRAFSPIAHSLVYRDYDVLVMRPLYFCL